MFPSSIILMTFHLFLRILSIFLPQERLARDFEWLWHYQDFSESGWRNWRTKIMPWTATYILAARRHHYGNTGCGVFKRGGTRLERFLPKNQYTQRKLLNFEKWVNGEVSKSAKIWLSKSIFYVKIIGIFLNFFHWINLGPHLLFLIFFNKGQLYFLKWCSIFDTSPF